MKAMVKAIIAGVCITVFGIIILLCALGLNGWTLKAHFDTLEFNAEQDDTEIIVENSVGSVKINYYDGEKIQIFYPQSKNYSVGITERDGYVKLKSPKPKWYNFSIWRADIPETVINLPQSTTFKLNLTVNAGTLRLSGNYSSVGLNVNAGTLKASDIVCETLSAKVNAGSMQLDYIRCRTSFKGEVSAGSLNLSGIDCPDITAKVSAGSLNMKVIGSKSDYNISTHVSAGRTNLYPRNNATSDKWIHATVSAGSLNVYFVSD